MQRQAPVPPIPLSAIAYLCVIDPGESDEDTQQHARGLAEHAHRIGYQVTDTFIDLDEGRACFKYLVLALNSIHGRGETPTVLLPEITTLGPTSTAQDNLLHILHSTGADVLLMT